MNTISKDEPKPGCMEPRVWEYIRVMALGILNGDREQAREARTVRGADDPALYREFSNAVRYLAFAAISGRISHRPFTVEDAKSVLDELLPKIRILGVAASDDELLNAIKIALVLPPEPSFNPDNANESRKVVGAWMILIGVRIDDESELERMRPGAERWLASKGIIGAAPS